MYGAQNLSIKIPCRERNRYEVNCEEIYGQKPHTNQNRSLFEMHF